MLILGSDRSLGYTCIFGNILASRQVTAFLSSSNTTGGISTLCWVVISLHKREYLTVETCFLTNNILVVRFYDNGPPETVLQMKLG